MAFRGPAHVGRHGGQAPFAAKELVWLSFHTVWRTKQPKEWQQWGLDFPRPTPGGLLLPCKPHFLKVPQPHTSTAPDESQAFKAWACTGHFRFKTSTGKDTGEGCQ